MTWAMSVDLVGAGIADLEDAYRASRQFVPVEFLERVGRSNFREVQRGDAVSERMTILFFDIRGFTTLAEKRTAEEMFGLVNRVIDRLEPHVRAGGGFVTTYTGDGFAALFASESGGVQAAIGIQRELDRMNAEDTVGEPIIAGIGLHTGPVMLGTVGGSNYLTVSVVADAVNLAARVEGMTKLYGCRVLVTSATAAGLGRDVGLRQVDLVTAKGRTAPIGLFQVVDAERAEVASRVDPARFAAARVHYAREEFDAAAAAFDALVGDPVAALLAARCRAVAEHPPATWDGVWRLEQK
jgi:class 3 adenylate cyclase